MAYDELISEHIAALYEGVIEPTTLQDKEWAPYVLKAARKYRKVLRYLHNRKHQHLREQQLMNIFNLEQRPTKKIEFMRSFEKVLLNHFDKVGGLQMVQAMHNENGEKISLLLFYQKILQIDPSTCKEEIKNRLDELTSGIPTRYQTQLAMYDALQKSIKKEGSSVFVDHLPIYFLEFYQYIMEEKRSKLEHLFEFLYDHFVSFIAFDSYRFPSINRVCRSLKIHPKFLEEHRKFRNEKTEYVTELAKITIWQGPKAREDDEM